jgi:MFS family permease
VIAKKQLLALFACGLVAWIIIQTMLALLPVFAVRLGADPAWTGNYLSIASAALMAGTISAGWLSDKFQRRKALFIGSGIANIPAIWLMGQATAFWHLIVLTSVVWFLIGLTLTLISILAGLFAGETERGKVFGILAVNGGLGALIGGSLSGRIADEWGFAVLFLVACLLWVLLPVIALLIQDKVVTKPSRQPESDLSIPSAPVFGIRFYLLLLATLIAFGAGFVALLGRPLLMDDLGFDSTAISGVIAVGGAVSLPFPLLLGTLSDRIGRYWLIVVCFLVGAFGLVILAYSVSLWHFWFSAVLLAAVGASLAIGPALVTDLVPQENLGRALAWYGFAPPAGGIIGFTFWGYAIQNFGLPASSIGGAVLTLIAAILILYLQRARPIASPSMAAPG